MRLQVIFFILFTLAVYLAPRFASAGPLNTNLSAQAYCHLGGICVLICDENGTEKVSLSSFVHINAADGSNSRIILERSGSADIFTHKVALNLMRLNKKAGLQFESTLKAVSRKDFIPAPQNLILAPDRQGIQGHCSYQVLARYDEINESFIVANDLFVQLSGQDQAGALTHMSLLKMAAEKLKHHKKPLSTKAMVSSQRLARRLFLGEEDARALMSQNGSVEFSQNQSAKRLAILVKAIF